MIFLRLRKRLVKFDQRARDVSPGRAQPAGGLAVVALRRRDVSRGAVGRRVDRLVAVAGPSTPNVAKVSKRCQVCKVLLYILVFQRLNFREFVPPSPEICPIALWSTRRLAAAAPRYVVLELLAFSSRSLEGKAADSIAGCCAAYEGTWAGCH